MKKILKTSELREQAEIIQRERMIQNSGPPNLSPDEIGQIIHELQVHQIELELQNEELRRSQHELIEMKANYYELYDLAPVGYIIVNSKGLVLKTNQMFASMLSKEKESLSNQLFSNYVLFEDQDIFYQHLRNLSSLRTEQTCELHLKKKDQTPFYVQLKSNVISNERGETEQYSIVVIDITERKQKDEALQRQSEEYQAVLRTAMDGFWMLDSSGNFLYVSGRYCKMIGYSRQELLKMNVKDIDTESSDETSQTIRQVMKDGFGHFEKLHKTKDGRLIEVEVNTTYLDSGGGQFCVFVRNITKRKKMERELRASEERYKALFERSIDCVFINDFEGNFIDANSAALDLLGFKKEEIASLNYLSLLSDDQLPLALKGIQEVMENGHNNGTSEYKLKRKDGTFVQVETSSSLIYSEGKPIAIQGIARDITERKLTEESLLNKKDFIEAVIENIPGMLYVYDDEGVHILHNRKHELMTGYSAEELSQMNPLSWYDNEDDIQKVKKAIDDVFTEGYGEVEVPMQIKSGEKRMMHFTGSKLLIKAKKYFVGVGTDITDRKEVEKVKEDLQTQLRQVQRLESIGILAGGIAHDFNNLLNIIMGNVSMAQRNDNLDEREKYLAEALTGVKRANNLTQQLLAFAKGEIPSKKLASVSEIIRESIDLSLGNSSLVKCKLCLVENLWMAEMDTGQIGQAIRNLIINANQAMPEGGTIQIWAENVVLQTDNSLGLEAGNFVHITIKDSGGGIPKKYIDKIFYPYFTTKDNGRGGSGLGLAIVHSVIQKHGGHIKVNSVQDKGTTFHIYLPAIKRNVEKVKLAPKTSDSITGLKILVMDDEGAIRNMLSQMLKRLEHEVELSEHGEEALEKYTTANDSGKPFDLVILDLTIPGGMGGEEVFAKLSEIDPEVKAVVSSGFSNKALSGGFVAKMPKPYDMKTIKMTINKIFNQ